MIDERTRLRMGDVAVNKRRLRTRTTAMWTLAPSGSVEPKHWRLTRAIAPALEGADPKWGARFLFGRVQLTTRKAPQSTPSKTDGSDYRSNHSHKGAKPVRFSNGQQQT